MPKVAVEISGVLYDKISRTQRPVTIKGSALVLEIPEGGEGIWGPTDPRPTPPIHLPGGGGEGIWGPNDPRPTPPIHLPVPEPPEPEVPPGTPPDTVVKSAPAGGWGYFTDAQGAPYSAYRPREDEHGPKAGR